MSKSVVIKSAAEFARWMSDPVFREWYKEKMELVELAEREDSPHLSYVYRITIGDVHEMSVVVQSKNNLNRQYFKNMDQARDVLSKFTLKGK
jgi:hypothetical protein